MEIKRYNHTSELSFKGYDARLLKGLMFTDKRCADAVKKVLNNTQFDIYLPNIASKSIRKEHFQLVQNNKLLWAQDYITFLNHKVKAVLFDNSRDFLKRVMRATADGAEKNLGYESFKSEPHLRGGNFFLCTNNGKRELLIGENRQLYPDNFIKTIFNVEKVHTIPKIDYHLDLFIRPLDNGNVLVSDINMTRQGMEKGIEKIKKYMSQNNLPENEKEELETVINNIDLMIKKLDITLKFDKYKPIETLPKIITSLEEAGYNPIRVPGSYHYLQALKTREKVQEVWNNFKKNSEMLKDWSKKESQAVQAKVNKFIELGKFRNDNNKNLGAELETFYENNFINAIAAKRDDGKIVYVTNAPLLDKKLEITPEIEKKTGFSTKNMFIESVAPYINKENIHFIDEKLTKTLFEYMGGIHCTAAEIPAL